MQNQAAVTMKNKWFEERRSLFVKNMLKEFYDTFTVFGEIYTHYISYQEVSFEQIDKLIGKESEKGVLWRLKDRCHQLWRDANPEHEMSGRLLDWVMGSIFHETMKLKENIYMFQFYGPLAESMKKENSTVKFCGVECQKFMERTYQEIQKQMENLGFMFGRANFLLRAMMPDQAHNDILVRYLIENEDIVDYLWNERLDALFDEMFASPEEGYCLAAKSYLEGQWYQQALETYSIALKKNPASKEALQNIESLRAIHQNSKEKQ